MTGDTGDCEPVWIGGTEYGETVTVMVNQCLFLTVASLIIRHVTNLTCSLEVWCERHGVLIRTWF